MATVNRILQKAVVTPKKTVSKKQTRIKLEFDKELETLSGTIIFPEKLALANKFLSKAK